MDIIPALDLRGGKCVRLTRGDYTQEKIYAEDPLVVAEEFRRQGATRLHLVDLDGAREGTPRYFDVARQIVESTKLAVEYGGGIRTMDAIEQAMASGITKVIIGTAAFRSPQFLAQALASHRQAVLVSVDELKGRVMAEGWTVALNVDMAEVIPGLVSQGVTGIVYTDTERDGTLEGVETTRLAGVLKCTQGIEVQVAGGVRDAGDIRKLMALSGLGLHAVIIGKALYEGTLKLPEALALVRGTD